MKALISLSGRKGGSCRAAALVNISQRESETWTRRGGWLPGSAPRACRAAAYTWARHWLTWEARSRSRRSRAVLPGRSSVSYSARMPILYRAGKWRGAARWAGAVLAAAGLRARAAGLPGLAACWLTMRVILPLCGGRRRPGLRLRCGEDDGAGGGACVAQRAAERLLGDAGLLGEIRDLRSGEVVRGRAGEQVEEAVVEAGQGQGLLPVAVGGVGGVDPVRVALECLDPRGDGRLDLAEDVLLGAGHGVNGGCRRGGGYAEAAVFCAQPGGVPEEAGDVPFVGGEDGDVGGVVELA